MTPAVTDWNGVALAKLTKVLGDEAGRRVMAEVLLAMKIPALRSAADLRELAAVLATKDGFAGAIGGLLSLHATMYESRDDTR